MISPLRLIYLGLALWGALHPMAHYLSYTRATGSGLRGLITAWFANGATTGLAWDVLIAGIALTVWVVAETTVRRNWLALIVLPVTLGIGISCGLPLYLYLRTRPVT